MAESPEVTGFLRMGVGVGRWASWGSAVLVGLAALGGLAAPCPRCWGRRRHTGPDLAARRAARRRGPGGGGGRDRRARRAQRSRRARCADRLPARRSVRRARRSRDRGARQAGCGAEPGRAHRVHPPPAGRGARARVCGDRAHRAPGRRRAARRGPARQRRGRAQRCAHSGSASARPTVRSSCCSARTSAACARRRSRSAGSRRPPTSRASSSSSVGLPIQTLLLGYEPLLLRSDIDEAQKLELIAHLGEVASPPVKRFLAQMRARPAFADKPRLLLAIAQTEGRISAKPKAGTVAPASGAAPMPPPAPAQASPEGKGATP